MTDLPEPLRVVLRDFCHVEWYEIDELAQLVESGGAKFDVAALEKQIEALEKQIAELKKEDSATADSKLKLLNGQLTQLNASYQQALQEQADLESSSS